MIVQAGKYLVNLDHVEWVDFSHQDEVWFYFHGKEAPLVIHNQDAKDFKDWAEEAPELVWTRFEGETDQ